MADAGFKSVEFVTTHGNNIAINPAHVVACWSASQNVTHITMSTGVVYEIGTKWANVVIQLERGH